MKTLLYKQMKLVAHPMTFIFALFGVMLMIPNYPYTVAFFYVTLGFFFMYLNARDQRDISYSMILPVKKTDLPVASISLCVLLELFSMIFAVPFAVLSSKLNEGPGNLAGINANLSLFAFAFLLYAIFNILFFTSFYKSGYKVGASYIKGVIGVFFIVAMDVVLPYIEVFSWLDASFDIRQVILFIVSVIIYIVSLVITLIVSKNRFEKVDL